MSNIKGLRLVIAIAQRGKGKKITKIFESLGVRLHYIVLGYGTASEEILQYLGFSTIEKDVVISLADVEIVPFMLNSLKMELDFNTQGKGIAFSIPIQSVASKRALDYIIGSKENERG